MESKYLGKYLKAGCKPWNYKEYKGQRMEKLVAVNEFNGIGYCQTGNNFQSHNIASGRRFIDVMRNCITTADEAQNTES